MRHFVLLLVATGLTGCSPSSSSSSSQGPWDQAASYGGSAVWFARSFTIGNHAYVGSGYGPTRAFWRYELDADAWTPAAELPGVARGAAVAFATSDAGYVALGYDGSGQVGDLWRYDPQTNSWASRASLPGSPRDHACALVIGSQAYVVGGTLGDGPTVSFLVDVWAYDLASDVWTRKADLPESVLEPACFVVSGKGYVSTGRRGTSLSTHTWEYDPQADAWTPLADFPGTARYAAVGFSAGGQGYVGTGMESAGPPATVLDDLWRYDPASDSWTETDHLPAAVGGAAAFVVGTTACIGTGGNSSGQCVRDFWCREL